MPTASESVSNRPIAGSDLAKIILSDVEKMLKEDGGLSPQIAYGKVAYSVRLQIHTDNPSLPMVESNMHSKRAATNDPDVIKQAIEPGPPPLPAATDDSYVIDKERTRIIDSPNLARLEHGIPVTVTSRTQDGHFEENQIVYPAEALDLADEHTEVKDTNSSMATRKQWVKKTPLEAVEEALGGK